MTTSEPMDLDDLVDDADFDDFFPALASLAFDDWSRPEADEAFKDL